MFYIISNFKQNPIDGNSVALSTLIAEGAADHGGVEKEIPLKTFMNE